jgi:hypothetical protein
MNVHNHKLNQGGVDLNFKSDRDSQIKVQFISRRKICLPRTRIPKRALSLLVTTGGCGVETAHYRPEFVFVAKDFAQRRAVVDLI